MDFFFRIQILIFTLSDCNCRLRNFFVKTEKCKQTRENILFTFLTQFWPGTTALGRGLRLPCLSHLLVTLRSEHCFQRLFHTYFWYSIFNNYWKQPHTFFGIMWLESCIKISLPLMIPDDFINLFILQNFPLLVVTRGFYLCNEYTTFPPCLRLFLLHVYWVYNFLPPSSIMFFSFIPSSSAIKKMRVYR